MDWAGDPVGMEMSREVSQSRDDGREVVSGVAVSVKLSRMPWPSLWHGIRACGNDRGKHEEAETSPGDRVGVSHDFRIRLPALASSGGR